ncbi:hypothetical protein GRI62_03400 [Erythrobacter arachoides]|uniref:Uncharacterized protein n=2 Tax=Aurantiacibacter arachoides TaxID=1850444 RepID=A0A844ZZJ6_9SPHN|nr:hypothetical protein [Aurantiacibacter arachoides]
MVLASVPAAGTDASFTVRAVVPVYCEVQHRGAGSVALQGQSISLGNFREYCNSPGGYSLVVRYAPGTLQGTVLSAGFDQVVLDGSGEAVLSREIRPRFRHRTVIATPGERGFDTDRIGFDLLPANPAG